MNWFKFRCRIAAALRSMATKVSPITIPRREPIPPRTLKCEVLVGGPDGGPYLCHVKGNMIQIRCNAGTVLPGDTIMLNFHDDHGIAVL